MANEIQNPTIQKRNYLFTKISKVDLYDTKMCIFLLFNFIKIYCFVIIIIAYYRVFFLSNEI